MSFTLPALAPASAEIALLVMTCATIIVELYFAKQRRYLTYLVAQLSLIITAAFLFSRYAVARTLTFSDMFVADKLGNLLSLFILLSVFLVFAYSRHYVKEKKLAEGEFYILSLFSTLGMMILVSAHHFLPLYLGLELFTLPLFALVAMQRQTIKAQEAALKYFVLGAIASGMLLYGISMIYGVSGSLDFSQVAHFIEFSPMNDNLLFMFGLIFILVGIGFKFGAVPFHMWVPDVYEGAPTAVTLFISTAPKIAAVGMALRILTEALPSLRVEWQDLLIIMAILSIGIGNFLAIAQTNFKRMLAYSSIAHMGYMSLGLLSGNVAGYAGAVFYIIIYSLMSACAFAILVLLSRAGVEIENIADLKGLNTRNPWLAFMLLLVMFSMAGIPPLAGFFAKIAVLEALLEAHLVWLAVLAVGFAIVGLYYYIRVVRVMYFDEPVDDTPFVYDLDHRVLISINGLALLGLGLLPGGLFTACRAAFAG